jgi:inner membrane protease ATP23
MSEEEVAQLKVDRLQRCRGMLEKCVQNDERVHTIIDAIEDMGCPIPKDFFVCRSADKSTANVGGQFQSYRRDPKNDPSSDSKLPQIVMYDHDLNILHQPTFSNTLVHELVHAYDSCKMKIEGSNCLAKACTEIRAMSQSGECAYWQEIRRGHGFGVQGKGKECIVRRAELSVAAHAECRDVAKDAVLAAYDFCSKQKEPLGYPKSGL